MKFQTILKTFCLLSFIGLVSTGCSSNFLQNTPNTPNIKKDNNSSDYEYLEGIKNNDLQQRINDRYIEKIMNSHGLKTREEAIEQIIEIESTYRFKTLLEKKGLHKAMNSDKAAIMAFVENSYQKEKSVIEEKKFDGTIKSEVVKKDSGAVVKRTKLNQKQSNNVAETKGAMKALKTVEYKGTPKATVGFEPSIIDTTK